MLNTQSNENPMGDGTAGRINVSNVHTYIQGEYE